MTDLASTGGAAPRWPATWLRALLPSAILACVEDVPLHGYAIGRALGDRGFGIPKGGSLYSALAQLEEAGAIAAEWLPGPSGPARQQYTLTAVGRRQLARDRTMLGALLNSLDPEGTAEPAGPESPEVPQPAEVSERPEVLKLPGAVPAPPAQGEFHDA